MATTSTARTLGRGEIEALPSGSLRVRVYAGIDPVSKKRNYLVETIPAGPGHSARRRPAADPSDLQARRRNHPPPIVDSLHSGR